MYQNNRTEHNRDDADNDNRQKARIAKLFESDTVPQIQNAIEQQNQTKNNRQHSSKCLGLCDDKNTDGDGQNTNKNFRHAYGSVLPAHQHANDAVGDEQRADNIADNCQKLIGNKQHHSADSNIAKRCQQQMKPNAAECFKHIVSASLRGGSPHVFLFSLYGI